MAAMPNSLLPPNSTPLERALEAGARPEPIVTPVASIDDPETCPANLLPLLAWGLSVDSWDADWSEADKRAAIAGSIALHRIKGTRLSAEIVLARFDRLLRIIEWHEANPPRPPHTFEVILPIADDGATAGGTRATAAFAEAIIREVTRVKPLREHFVLVQALLARASIGPQAVARPLLARRDDMAMVDDRSQPWETLLQNEDGEPLQSDDAGFLDTAP